jgi:hypothetical protein
MADITMCFHDWCPLGLTCRRNIQVTKPHFKQSWATFDRRADGGCDHLFGIDQGVDATVTSDAARAALAVEKSEGQNG